MNDRAVIWTAKTRLVDLHDYLTSIGVTGHEEWYLFKAAAVSDDGRTIVGTGGFADKTQAFLVTVPEPSTLVLAGLGCLVLTGRFAGGLGRA